MIFAGVKFSKSVFSRHFPKLPVPPVIARFFPSMSGRSHSMTLGLNSSMALGGSLVVP